MTAPMAKGPRSCKTPRRGELLAYAEEAEARKRLTWARIQGLGFPTERALHVYGNTGPSYYKGAWGGCMSGLVSAPG